MTEPDLRALNDAASPGRWSFHEWTEEGAVRLSDGSYETDTIDCWEMHLAPRMCDDEDFTDHPYLEKGALPKADMKFIVALVNAYRDGKLVEARDA